MAEEVSKVFQISFGILSPPITNQLIIQKFKYNLKRVEEFEEQLEAIRTLYYEGILNDKMQEKCTQKLFTRIRAHVCKINKLTIGKTKKINHYGKEKEI